MTRVFYENDEIVAIRSYPTVTVEDKSRKGIPEWLNYIAVGLGFGVFYWVIVFFLTL